MFDTALAAYLAGRHQPASYDLERLFAGLLSMTELAKPVYLEPDAFSLLGDSGGGGGQLSQRIPPRWTALYETLLRQSCKN